MNKYVEREIINHMKLRHPHIIGLREVSSSGDAGPGFGGEVGRHVPTMTQSAAIWSASPSLEEHNNGWVLWRCTAWPQGSPDRCLKSMQSACLRQIPSPSHPRCLLHALPPNLDPPAQVFLTSNHLVLAMEFAAGGDLFKYVSSRRSLPEPEARWIFQQLIVAIDYCHRMVRWVLFCGDIGPCAKEGRVCCGRGLRLFPLSSP